MRTIQVISRQDGCFDVGDTGDSPDGDLLTVPDLMEGLAFATSMAAQRGGLPTEIVCGPYKALLQ